MPTWLFFLSETRLVEIWDNYLCKDSKEVGGNKLYWQLNSLCIWIDILRFSGADPGFFLELSILRLLFFYLLFTFKCYMYQHFSISMSILFENFKIFSCKISNCLMLHIVRRSNIRSKKNNLLPVIFGKLINLWTIQRKAYQVVLECTCAVNFYMNLMCTCLSGKYNHICVCLIFSSAILWWRSMKKN